MSNKEISNDEVKAVREQIEIDPKTGLSKLSESVYADFLKENTGIEIDTVSQISAADTRFIAVLGKATGEAGVPVLHKNKDLDRITVVAPRDGKNKFEIDLKRETRNINPATKEEVVKHGVLSAKFDFYGTHNNGDFKKVRTEVSEAAAKKLVD